MNTAYDEIVHNIKNSLLELPWIHAAICFESGSIDQSADSISLQITAISQSTEQQRVWTQETGHSVLLSVLPLEQYKNRLEQVSMDSILDMSLQGELLFDRTGEVGEAIKALQSRVGAVMEFRTFREYSNILESIRRISEFCQRNYYLDAFSCLMESMDQWARMAIYQSGEFPRKDIWEQVKKVNVGIYKLYEELVYGEETLVKRIELMQLVYTNMILARSETYGRPLFDYLRKVDQPKTYLEILEEGHFKGMKAHLHGVLEKLVEMRLLEKQSGSLPVFEVKYQIAN